MSDPDWTIPKATAYLTWRISDMRQVRRLAKAVGVARLPGEPFEAWEMRVRAVEPRSP